MWDILEKGWWRRKYQLKYDSYFTAGKNTVHQPQAQVDTATQEVRRVYCSRGISLSAIAWNLSTISQRGTLSAIPNYMTYSSHGTGK